MKLILQQNIHVNSDITIERLRGIFYALNRDYFGSDLPEPRFLLTSSRTILGQFRCTHTLFSKATKDHTIKVSIYYKINEEQLRDIVAHEMIHYHIALKGLKDTSPHGRIFRREMVRLNATGLNISIRTDTSQWTVAGRSHKHERLVMALTTSDGKYMLTVANPKYARTINRMARNCRNVAAWQWFFTDDDRFACFSVVRSLRGRFVTREEFERQTASMKQLTEIFRHTN